MFFCVVIVVVVFFFFLIFFKDLDSKEVGNREKRSDHGSQNRKVRPRFTRVPFFFPRAVLEAKRTRKMNGSGFFRSDRTVRSGFQNLDNKE